MEKYEEVAHLLGGKPFTVFMKLIDDGLIKKADVKCLDNEP